MGPERPDNTRELFRRKEGGRCKGAPLHVIELIEHELYGHVGSEQSIRAMK